MWDRMLRSRWTYLAAAALMIALALSRMVQIELPARSKGDLSDLEALRTRDDVNVVFLLVDTLRSDHLSSYGYERSTSPFLDELGAHGIRFARVRAQSSWTKTSMASLWTATFPMRNGVLRYSNSLPGTLPLASEIFQQGGFRTGGIYRNGWVAPNFGFGRGFDLYVRPAPVLANDRMKRRGPDNQIVPGNDYDATQAALAFAQDHLHERFLLYVHYMDVHQYTYDQESALFGTRYVDAYDNAIHWTDRNIAALFKGLADLDLLDRTIIVIAADHGEAFYEHGNEGHGRDIYAETTWTPWILSLPFNLENGVVIEDTVRNIDIWPTVLDLVGLPPLPDAQGQSLLPLVKAVMRGEPIDGLAPDPDGAYLNRLWGQVNTPPRPLASLTRDGHRLILDICRPESAQLFDLRNDPGEAKNLAAQKPELVAALKQELEKQLAADEAIQADATEVHIDEMRLEQLRALGYVLKPGDRGIEEDPEAVTPCLPHERRNAQPAADAESADRPGPT